MYMISYEIGSHPNLREFAAAIGASNPSLESIAAIRRLLLRRKKAPTRFYKEREHTAEGLKVYRVGSSSPFF